MSKFIKKSWYNICGAADFVYSRFQTNPVRWVGSTVIGTACGAALGAGAAFMVQDDADNWDSVEAERSTWIENNASYKAVASVVNFPKICGLGNAWYVAAKAPNGDYTLYAGSQGFYEPVDTDQIDSFVERYNDCIDATRALNEQQQHFYADFGKSISQPLRSDNTLRDGAYSFRKLSDESRDDFDGHMADLAVVLGSEDKAFAYLEESWSDAIEAFEDGDIYDHADARDVQTYAYEYKEPDFPLSTVFDFMLFGVFAGVAGAAFSGKPNDAAKQRAARRETKRNMLNHDDLQF